MATQLKEKTTSPTITKKAFIDVNDKQVDDISLEFFYKPHTITLLIGCIVFLTFLAFSRDPNADFRGNVLTGCGGLFIFFMVISILAFPNGPFTRPHPIIWRMVFGCSVLYLLIVQFLIHQGKQIRTSPSVGVAKARYFVCLHEQFIYDLLYDNTFQTTKLCVP